MEKESPFKKKCCADCAFLYAYVNLWCGNKEAINARGTRIPGIIKCPYWKPDWRQIPKEHKTLENGYKPKTNLFKKIWQSLTKS